jgi:high-affinity iron transporter
LNPGSLSGGLLTGLREGVEGALIVAIILAYLAKTGNARHFGKILLGAGSAIAVSVVGGVVLYQTVGGFGAPYEQIFEGAAMLLAAGVVTWMLFWMRRQAASVKGDLQAAVDRVLTEGSVWGLALLAFTAVIREGIETSLFLVGQATSTRSDAPSVIVGAALGLGIAVALGVGFYHGSRRLNLQAFFRWTGIALVFIAAGLLSHAVHEFVDVGIVGVGIQPAYDISPILPDDQGAGQFLRAIFGYSARPEVVTLLVHVAYVVTVLGLYLRPVRPPAATARQTPAGAARR